jgi:hypothetical protein
VHLPIAVGVEAHRVDLPVARNIERHRARCRSRAGQRWCGLALLCSAIWDFNGGRRCSGDAESVRDGLDRVHAAVAIGVEAHRIELAVAGRVKPDGVNLPIAIGVEAHRVDLPVARNIERHRSVTVWMEDVREPEVRQVYVRLWTVREVEEVR